MPEAEVPDAELLIADGCPHCPAVLHAMSDLLKQGRLGRLTVINLSRHPEEAERRGARGVPWIRIGPFELSGSHRPSELAEWAERAGTVQGRQTYLREQLEQGELDRVIGLCEDDPVMLNALLALTADLETPFAVRIGIGAVFEELGPRGRLVGLAPDIAQTLAHSEHAQLRADAAHFLGLTGSPDAHAALEPLAADPDPSVREVAAEAQGQLPRSTR